MMIDLLTGITRRILTGAGQKFVFDQAREIEVSGLKKIGLYIHIPFCKNLCPYCPYNRVIYDKNLINPYLNALLAEIDMYHQKLGRIEISSIYIGGGTPTTMIDELGTIIKAVKEKFLVSGDVCIETNPSDLSQEIIGKLISYGISLISIGVQSFDDKQLRFLGRRYDPAKAKRAVGMASSAGFRSVNIDLMFILPGQNEEEMLSDIKEAMGAEADQITVYPLFTFPYSAAGECLKLKKVKMPGFRQRRRSYRKLHEVFEANGYRRVSVWGFKRGSAPRYSSVTRDHFIGMGAGAGSRLPKVFYFNTFSVNEYVNSASTGKLPVALSMKITPKLSKYYWLYWRLYDTFIEKSELHRIFGKRDICVNMIFAVMKFFGLVKEKEKMFELTERGSFYIHLFQNYFVLKYINKVWSAAKKEAWPRRIAI